MFTKIDYPIALRPAQPGRWRQPRVWFICFATFFSLTVGGFTEKSARASACANLQPRDLPGLSLPAEPHGVTGANLKTGEFGLNETEASRLLQQSFIWLPSAPAGKQVYAVFRKQFSLETAPSRATLRVFADSRYTLWISPLLYR